MATYTITINERMSIGKSILAFLQSIPQAISFEMPVTQLVKPQNKLYKSLNSAFHDVRLMIDGKKQEKSVEEFLNEL